MYIKLASVIGANIFSLFQHTHCSILLQISPVFSKSEFVGRLSVFRKYMEDNEIDAAVFNSIANICYYSGFTLIGFGRMTGLVVTQDKTSVITASVGMC